MADVTEIDGAYGSLKADEGYFVGQTAISDVTATEAAAEADDLVDELFADWDRSGWAARSPDRDLEGMAQGRVGRIHGPNPGAQHDRRGRKGEAPPG